METDDRHLAIRVVLLPKDTNAHGTIFGGVILSHLDLAGAVEARRHTTTKVVTVAMDAVEFHMPVFLGDIVSFYTRLVHRGRTSLGIHVDVEVERLGAGAALKVTEADVTFVCVDQDGGKTAIQPPESSSG